MLVGMSSIITLFNLVLVGIKQIKETNITNDTILKRKVTAVKLKLDEIQEVSKVIFDVIYRDNEHGLSIEEMKTISITHLKKIESLLGELYRHDLELMLNLYPKDYPTRIKQLLNSSNQRENRLHLILNVIGEKKENVEMDDFRFEQEGEMIVEELSKISTQYSEFINEQVGHLE